MQCSASSCNLHYPLLSRLHSDNKQIRVAHTYVRFIFRNFYLVEENGKICFEVLVSCYPEDPGKGVGTKQSLKTHRLASTHTTLNAN